MRLNYIIRQIIDFPWYVGCGIENLIAWLPVIWSDRDFDWWYMFRIMEKKLGRMEYVERNYSYHMTAEKDAHRIMICRLLIKRIQADEHLENAEISHPHLTFRQHIYIAGYMQNQDMDMLFNIMRKHCLGWWS